jgi:molybdopterin-guanine dinucleotide biosynthesis protein A
MHAGYHSRVSFSAPVISDVTLAVLAGGEGARMGVAKGLLRISGRPILEYLLDRLAWPGPTALITAPGREHPPGWERFDSEWVDPVGGLGPLRGVLTALEQAKTQWIVVQTVDMPGIGREQIEFLLSSISPTDLGRMYERGRGPGGRVIDPFPLLIQATSATMVRQRIDRGALSVVRFLDQEEFCTISAPGHWSERVWINLNRPEDLEQFLTRV